MEGNSENMKTITENAHSDGQKKSNDSMTGQSSSHDSTKVSADDTGSDERKKNYSCNNKTSVSSNISKTKMFMKEKYETAMLKTVPMMKELITCDTVSSGLVTSFGHVLYELCNVPKYSASSVLIFMDIMYCNKGTNQKKDFFLSDTGLLVSKLRSTCLKNCVLHLARGLNDRLINNNKERKQSSSDRPDWISKVVPKTKLIEMVRKEEEQTGTDEWLTNRKRQIMRGTSISSDDSSLFVLQHLYRTIVNSLNRNRKTCRRSFTRLIGFLLLNWSDYGIGITQDVTVIWYVPYDIGLILRPSDVPTGKTLNEDGDVVEYNRKVFTEFILSREEMIIYVTYPVIITQFLAKTGKKRKRCEENESNDDEDSRQKRMYRRKMSLIEVAMVLIRDMCGIEHNVGMPEMMTVSKHILSVGYFMAIIIRNLLKNSSSNLVTRDRMENEKEVIEEHVKSSAENAKERDQQKESWLLGEEGTLENKRKRYDDIFKMIISGSTECRRILLTEVCKMKEYFFVKNHIMMAGDPDAKENGGTVYNAHDSASGSGADVDESSKCQADYEIDF